MSSLNFDQKVILSLYMKFYKEKYPTHLTSQDDVTGTHINAQKMCYLLKLYGVSIGDFGFTWNFHGPFSPGLLALLRSLDEQTEEVDNYYSNDYLNQSDLFLDDENNKIDCLIELLELNDHADQLGMWMELLGSFAYLSNSVYPGEKYDVVLNELIKRKSKFNNIDDNSKAWETLIKSGIVCK